MSRGYGLPAAARVMAVAAMLLAVAGGVALAGQPRDPTGNRNATTGSVGAGSSSGRTGPWVHGGGVLATVRLENTNLCVDNTTECVVYIVDPDSADPALMYAGNAIVVEPVFMRVLMLDESMPIQDACRSADFLPVSWRDVVEDDEFTRASIDDVLRKMHDQAATNEGARYRLLWCPIGEDGVRNDWNPKGQSWRFILLRRSLTPRPPGALR